MKKITAIFIVALVASLSGCDKVRDSVLNSDLEEVEATANYELSTYGFDSRVYEWTPAHNPNITCVFVAASESSGVACYPKAK